MFINFSIFLNLDSCEIYNTLRSQIATCNQVYSMNNQEESSFDLKWNSFNTNISISSNSISDSFIFTQSSQINSQSYTGQVNTYSGGGYIYKMKDFNSTKYLHTLKWIDSQTVALFVEFTLFNPNINLFMYNSILFEQNSAGSFVNTARFSSIDLYSINKSQFISFQLILAILYLILIVGFLFSQAYSIIRYGLIYFLNAYNYINLTLVAFTWSTFAMFLYRLYASYKTCQNLSNKAEEFINLQSLDYYDECLNNFMGICVFCATLRLINVFRFNKRVIVYLMAFKRSLNEIILFALIFLTFWLAFVQVFYLLMNNETIQYASVVNSMETCFQVILGKFNSHIFSESKYWLAPFLFIAYNVIVIFVFLNLLVAILIENFHLSQNDVSLDRDDPELFSYLKSLFSLYFGDWFKRRKQNEKTNGNLKDISILNRFDSILIRIRTVFLIFKCLFYFLRVLFDLSFFLKTKDNGNKKF